MTDRAKAINLIKDFLKINFPRGIQTFRTRNICGDPLSCIYIDFDESITIDLCIDFCYIEIIGITEEEYLDILKNTTCYH